MLRWRVSTDRTPRTKNGQPPHSTTGVANTSCTRFDAPCGQRRKAESARPSPAPQTGSASAAEIHKRRVMSASSPPSSAPPRFGLERHAANGAGAGSELADVRMHRAGIDRALRRRRGAAPFLPDIFLDRRRTCRGSRPSRRRNRGRDGCDGAGSSPHRPSCRTPDRWRCRRRYAPEPKLPRCEACLKRIPGRGI